MSESKALIALLREPETIRKQSHRLLSLAQQDVLTHFGVNLEKMTDTVSFVIDVIKTNYPDLNIPYHSRWRHFEVGNKDRIKALKQQLSTDSKDDNATILFELVIISVLLDAGSGASWKYQEQDTGTYYSRSEGLAIASLDLYLSGALSTHPKIPYRIDAQALISFNEEQLIKAFQVSSKNTLEGLSGRVSLLNRLGVCLQQKPQYFGSEGRLGDFYSYIKSLQINKKLSATTLFQAVLDAFNDIWPQRQGQTLGDVWIHKALKSDQFGSEYLPFHKLSQWLTYSLLEPLEQSGIQVIQLDALTGLPEYRNGGLLIDTGLLTVKNKALFSKAQDPSSEAIIEWRGLTVALLDELAQQIRQQLHQNENSLPLAKILQGGTWEAGRKIAKQKRSQGIPPIQIISDGTVF